MPAHSADQTAEAIWQNKSSGFTKGLLEAEALEDSGEKLAADVMRASIFYSYASGQSGVRKLLALWYFGVARWYVGSIIKRNPDLSTLSGTQCDVLGTILLRKLLWWPSRPAEALVCLEEGLKRIALPPHDRALLHIGLAEAYLALRDRERALQHMQNALELEGAIRLRVQDSTARVHGMRQFTRVLKRAMVLSWHLGDEISARELYGQALFHARHPEWKSLGQAAKIQEAMNALRHPRVWHRLFG